MLLEKDAQEQCQVLNKVLFVLFAVLVCLTDVGAEREHLGMAVTVVMAIVMVDARGGKKETGVRVETPDMFTCYISTNTLHYKAAWC